MNYVFGGTVKTSHLTEVTSLKRIYLFVEGRGSGVGGSMSRVEGIIKGNSFLKFVFFFFFLDKENSMWTFGRLVATRFENIYFP